MHSSFPNPLKKAVFFVNMAFLRTEYFENLVKLSLDRCLLARACLISTSLSTIATMSMFPQMLVIHQNTLIEHTALKILLDNSL